MKDEEIAKIEELINEFPDDRYTELLEEMIDHAQAALNARREEEAKQDES